MSVVLDTLGNCVVVFNVHAVLCTLCCARLLSFHEQQAHVRVCLQSFVSGVRLLRVS